MFQFETGDSVQWFRVKNCGAVEPKRSYAVWGHGIFGAGAMAIPDQAKRCEQYARDCLRLAKRTSSTHERELLVQMAETWRRLAEQAKGSGESNADGD
jgi:hypothetical protein